MNPPAGRQRPLVCAPAAMLQHAAERRLAVYVAGQAQCGGIEPRLDLHPRTTLLRIDALDAQALLERGAAPGMDGAHRGTDLRVVVRLDVLLQEIDQAALPLQQSEQAQGAGRPRGAPPRARRR